MKDCDCKIRFEAEDGTLFDTGKECKEYESRPHVWIARSNSDILRIFITKKEAELFKWSLIESKRGLKIFIERIDVSIWVEDAKDQELFSNRHASALTRMKELFKNLTSSVKSRAILAE